jgi:Cu(I)/Ag(I) efflux system membrane fusion protein
VLAKNVREQAYVKAGDALYTIADLSTVWLLAEVFEQDLPWVEPGLEAAIEVEAVPGRTFTGKVAFVDPVVNEATRTVRVRLELANPEGLLKPGMFARVELRAVLRPDARGAQAPPRRAYACPMHPEVQADEPGTCRICKMDLEPTGAAAKAETQPAAESKPAPKAFTCPMHPQVQADEPGRCPICKMRLVPTGAVRPPQAGTETRPADTRPAVHPAEHGAATRPSLLPLAVPRSAVLDSGVRRIVWVEDEPGSFTAREVVLGPLCGDDYPVLSGLAEGERVVVRGNFLLDSQAQISGKPSLLFPKGLAPAAGGHAGHSPADPAGHGEHKR